MNPSHWFLFIFYALMSTAALLLMKAGLSNSAFHVHLRPNFSATLGYTLILGMLLYVMSFLTWLIIIRTAPMTIAYPLSIGLIQLFLMGGSYFLLHGKISVYTVLGSVLVLAGIVLLSVGGATSS